MRKLIEVLFPPKELMHSLDDMSSTRYHIKQLERLREPEVESEASAARPMKLVADSGEYYGLGHTIVDMTDAQ